jgi:hypothetical protein
MKPVAYINVEERKLEWAEPITWHTPTIAQMEKIPLYTYPAKTLTDEEIIELEQKWLGVEIVDCKDLIRAALKKASEK